MACRRASGKRRRRVTVGQVLLLSGSACLIIVVLTHVAEAFHILPAMGWGLPNSVGHYLDLASAILGCALLPLGFLAIILTRRKNSK
jgi:hypothetical protein